MIHQINNLMKLRNIYISIKSKAVAIVSVAAFSMAFLVGCQTDLENGIYPNESSPMIDEFLAENDNLSMFLAMIEKADLRGMSHAYGTYTCFAPTNAAVKEYLSAKEESLESLTQEQASYYVKYHFVSDTISTADFNESRLNAQNMAKHYISTKTEMNDENQIVIKVDRCATIISPNNRLGNGYVHVVDAMLGRPIANIETAVADMPDEEFSVMKSILAEIKQSYPEITISSYVPNDTTYITFMAQTNKAFEEANISDMQSLLVRLRENDIQSAYGDKELVDNWLGYHCLQGRVYMKDILGASSLNTWGNNQVITVTMVTDTIFLNRFKTENIDEDGIVVDRQGYYVDYSCYDGLIQTAFNALEIIERSAYRVYWDMADQPEFKALKNFRKAGANELFYPGDLSKMNWGGNNNPTVRYICDGVPEINGSWDAKSQYVYGDYLQFRVCTNVMQWLEITTPVLVAGRYKVWICWRRFNPGKFRTTFIQDGEEDQVLPASFSLEDYMPTAGDETQREAQGWKQYTAKALNSVVCSKNIGIIEVKHTGEHILRFDPTIGSKDVGANWDMIQFIPIDEDQLYPRIAIDGSLVYKGTPNCEIFPEDGSNCIVDEEE